MIKKETKDFSMEALYKYVGVSRQSLRQNKIQWLRYAHIEREIIEKVHTYREDHCSMGSRALYYTMLNNGEELPIGVTKFEQLLGRKNLTVGRARSQYPKTSDGKGKEDYKNLTNGLIINDINQLIVVDITYFDIPECRTYIFTLKDVYSQTFISLTPSKNMEHDNGLQCLDEMKKLRGREVFENCIHHSDNGSQYNANAYKTQVTKMGMTISRAGSSQENGSSEQLNHIAKNMYLSKWGITTFKQLQRACKKLVILNNESRAIAQLGYISPMMFEKKIKELPIEQHPQKVMHDFTSHRFSRGIEDTKYE
jgi:transposase InsO family protein